MNNSFPLISVGFVGCNRLFYLKSCIESFVETTRDYPNIELIIVDNASIEINTKEYLTELESRGYKVFRQPKRDPSNEFAKGLNIICREAKGKYIIPLQGDMQFVTKGWLPYYVEIFEQNPNKIGCAILDAQRKITIESRQFSEKFGDRYGFRADLSRDPISGAADVFYQKSILDMLGPWSENNENHEGGGDSETKMLARARQLIKEKDLKLVSLAPIISPSVAIFNKEGTNARIRGNRRYGSYYPPKDGTKYYEIQSIDEWKSTLPNENGKPYPIELMARPIGHENPLDERGNWIKKPIDPKTALPHQYVELDEVKEESIAPIKEKDEYMDEWLNE